MSKYYFYTYHVVGGNIREDERLQSGVLENVHPIVEIAKTDRYEDYSATLLSWQEITEEEYKLHVQYFKS